MEKRKYLYCCTHCGWYDVVRRKDLRNDRCKYCKTPIKFLDITQLLEDNNDDFFLNLDKEIREQFLKENVYNQPELDVDLMKQREIDEDRDIQELVDSVRNSKPTISCPYCNSTNTRKISSVGRLFSAGLFGLGSGRLGKQWHCNNCKSDF